MDEEKEGEGEGEDESQGEGAVWGKRDMLWPTMGFLASIKMSIKWRNPTSFQIAFSVLSFRNWATSATERPSAALLVSFRGDLKFLVTGSAITAGYLSAERAL